MEIPQRTNFSSSVAVFPRGFNSKCGGNRYSSANLSSRYFRLASTSSWAWFTACARPSLAKISS